MTDASEHSPRRRRQTGRSPSYPAVSLPTAIDRARVLYAQERQFATPVASVAKHWGYSTLNGPAGLALAALKKYGLVTDEGAKLDRRVKISDLAVRILEHPDGEVRDAAIRDAALLPTIHREMWTEYGDELPSDSTLIWTLSKERGFTETGAREFVKEYRETLGFANLMEGGTTGPEDDDENAEESGDPETIDGGTAEFGARTKRYSPGDIVGPSFVVETKRSNPRIQTYTVPIGVGANVIVQGEFPLTSTEWTQFLAVLQAMRPGLVDDKADEAAEADDD